MHKENISMNLKTKQQKFPRCKAISQERKKTEIKTQNLSDMWDNLKGSNTRATGAPKGEERQVETEKNHEEIMSQISPDVI